MCGGCLYRGSIDGHQLLTRHFSVVVNSEAAVFLYYCGCMTDGIYGTSIGSRAVGWVFLCRD